jgi:very-short-patch-repair endonuclease
LHGLDVDPCDPVEITVAAPTTVSTRAGMVVRRRALDKRDVVKVHGYPVTSMLRTLRDLSRRLSLTDAVVIADMALHAGMVKREALRSLGSIFDHVEPAAESPMESRLRMLLVLARLPRPEAQVEIRDGRRFLGRVDLYYRDQRLGLEYDGGTHRNNLAEDNRRQNRLIDAGIRLLRFTASDIYNTPEVTVSMVRGALGL